MSVCRNTPYNHNLSKDGQILIPLLIRTPDPCRRRLREKDSNRQPQPMPGAMVHWNSLRHGSSTFNLQKLGMIPAKMGSNSAKLGLWSVFKHFLWWSVASQRDVSIRKWFCPWVDLESLGVGSVSTNLMMIICPYFAILLGHIHGHILKIIEVSLKVSHVFTEIITSLGHPLWARPIRSAKTQFKVVTGRQLVLAVSDSPWDFRVSDGVSYVQTSLHASKIPIRSRRIPCEWRSTQSWYNFAGFWWAPVGISLWASAFHSWGHKLMMINLKHGFLCQVFAIWWELIGIEILEIARGNRLGQQKAHFVRGQGSKHDSLIYS